MSDIKETKEVDVNTERISFMASKEHRKMVNEIATKIYRTPGNSSHALRCIIEDFYKSMVEKLGDEPKEPHTPTITFRGVREPY